MEKARSKNSINQFIKVNMLKVKEKGWVNKSGLMVEYTTVSGKMMRSMARG